MINTLKEVIRSWELSLATPDEIKAALEKQVVTDYKKIIIRRNDEELETHTYTF